jgi:hypothetical protein
MPWNRQTLQYIWEMTIFPKEFPTNIPRILAGFIGLNFETYWMTALIAEMKIGRPSSTSAIGFVFIPIYTLILMSLSYLSVRWSPKTGQCAKL